MFLKFVIIKTFLVAKGIHDSVKPMKYLYMTWSFAVKWKTDDYLVSKPGDEKLTLKI